MCYTYQKTANSTTDEDWEKDESFKTGVKIMTFRVDNRKRFKRQIQHAIDELLNNSPSA